jgi:hypothetical protein
MRDTKREGSRALRQRVLGILKSKDVHFVLESLSALSAPKVINGLFSLLHDTDEEIKWMAVTAMGDRVAFVADSDIEAGRVIIRRLMWNLNDESGGIGWGSPEAMGEILACHEGLAKEYSHVLLSYANVDGNYLEHEMLQRGLLWGIGRLAQERPQVITAGAEWIVPYLKSKDAVVRGLAAWVAGILGEKIECPLLEGLLKDGSEICVYMDRRLIHVPVKDLAREALMKIKRCKTVTE